MMRVLPTRNEVTVTEVHLSARAESVVPVVSSLSSLGLGFCVPVCILKMRGAGGCYCKSEVRKMRTKINDFK